MEEELIKIYEYKLKKEIIDKCIEENRELMSKDVEIAIHEILKENFITYKNKVVEYWTPTSSKYSKYNLKVEVYVYEIDRLKAKRIIDEYINEGE